MEKLGTKQERLQRLDGLYKYLLNLNNDLIKSPKKAAQSRRVTQLLVQLASPLRASCDQAVEELRISCGEHERGAEDIADFETNRQILVLICESETKPVQQFRDLCENSN
jgi:hypothetical protein